jgi:dihydropteroate synthase
MHMKGTPQTMQRRPAYKDVVVDIVNFFKERIRLCHNHGITKIILDPGIGFGKTARHNLSILRRFDEITALGYPALIGVSRKSFIAKSLDSPADERETGTVAANVVAIAKGARIIRVHDVATNLKAARMVDLISKS